MMLFLPLTALMLGAPAAAVTPDDRSAPVANSKAGDAPIVVTSVRLSDSRRKLQECIARHCPPKEDIAATLAHAENQFVEGDYRGAYGTLFSGRHRNQRFAKDYPVEVAGLLRARYRLAAHLGEGDAYLLGTIETLDALKSGLPANDAHVLAARVELADTFRRLGREDEAHGIYKQVLKSAEESNLVNVQAMTLIRLAMLEAGSELYGGYQGETKRYLDKILLSPDPRFQAWAPAAKLFQARLLYKPEDPAFATAVASALKTVGPAEKPILLYAPKVDTAKLFSRTIDRNSAISQQIGISTEFTRLNTRDFDDQWVDIAFYVTPDGRVSDADVIRHSKSLETTDWVKPVIASINGRQYLPLKRDPNDPGVLRVERYTLTSLNQTYAGSRIPQHSLGGRIEMLDLSADPPAPSHGI